MPKFLVKVDRVEYKTQDVEVEADDEDEAEQAAIEQAADVDYEVTNADDTATVLEQLEEN